MQFGRFYNGATIGTLTFLVSYTNWNSYFICMAEIQHFNDSNDTEGYNYVSGVNKRTASTVEFSIADTRREIHWIAIGK